MRTGLLLALLVVTVGFATAMVQDSGAGHAQASTGQEKKREKFDPNRDAVKDIAAGCAKAKKEGKRVILDVGGEWCPWCHKLDAMFHDNKTVADFLKANYVVVKVNFSQENENKEVLSKYPKIEGYPHLFVLDGDGKLLHSQDTGKLETGDHHDEEKVMTFLKKWAPERK